MREFRQYICLRCMKFWFVNELIYKYISAMENDIIPIPICPNCRGSVDYCGTHKDKGSRKLFGARIAELEYRVAISI